MNARATSFATLKDLRGYIKCRDGGGSPRACLAKGDNGEGAWGDTTATLKTPMCALPASEIRAKWGTPKAGRGKIVLVKIKGRPSFECEVRDIAPSGVIDLNPAALLAAGLPSDAELNEPCVWEWV